MWNGRAVEMVEYNRIPGLLAATSERPMTLKMRLNLNP
jgi:hypothetical protein